MVITNHHSTIIHGWRDAAGDTWHQYVNHEFVRGLGNGRLPRPAFVAYLVQDYIFLLHFSRAWAMAVVKSETVDQMRTAVATANALINEEIQLHIKICAREGISEEQLLQAEEAPENLAYTRFVMDAGISGDLLDLLAALAPCIFGYREISMRLANCTDTTPLYREWIDVYGSDNYRDVCDSVALLTEQISAAKLGNSPESSPRWPSLCKRFETATRLESNFWQMGLRLGQAGISKKSGPEIGPRKVG